MPAVAEHRWAIVSPSAVFKAMGKTLGRWRHSIPQLVSFENFLLPNVGQRNTRSRRNRLCSDLLPQRLLKNLLSGGSQFALIDVREAGEYNSSHIPGSSLIPRRQLEFQMLAAVPLESAMIVICDDDGRRAEAAAKTLERMGYTQVSVLEGGINRWSSMDYPTEWGTNVPSKDFGEKVEVVNHVPEIDADDLHGRIQRGEKLVILDTRTPEEYQRFCIPGGRSMPGGELAFRVTDVVKDLDPDTTVIVNCAGRTRSIIGTRVLQRMGFSNALGLKNGTSGWVAGRPSTGAGRRPAPTAGAIARGTGRCRGIRRQTGGRGWRSVPGCCKSSEYWRKATPRNRLPG